MKDAFYSQGITNPTAKQKDEILQRVRVRQLIVIAFNSVRRTNSTTKEIPNYEDYQLASLERWFTKARRSLLVKQESSYPSRKSLKIPKDTSTDPKDEVVLDTPDNSTATMPQMSLDIEDRDVNSQPISSQSSDALRVLLHQNGGLNPSQDVLQLWARLLGIDYDSVVSFVEAEVNKLVSEALTCLHEPQETMVVNEPEQYQAMDAPHQVLVNTSPMSESELVNYQGLKAGSEPRFWHSSTEEDFCGDFESYGPMVEEFFSVHDLNLHYDYSGPLLQPIESGV
ncbi:hypothetical protein VNI00_011697 [Paramarasmius palmivorus]|uniref:Uncharacterized protein n=1 Tax=Paramarasmius palmivorus TaxID=297713 RepID=A0AAW0CCV3_9AGAR